MCQNESGPCPLFHDRKQFFAGAFDGDALSPKTDKASKSCKSANEAACETCRLIYLNEEAKTFVDYFFCFKGLRAVEVVFNSNEQLQELIFTNPYGSRIL